MVIISRRFLILNMHMRASTVGLRLRMRASIRAGLGRWAHRLPLRVCSREVKMQAAEALAQEKYGKGWTEL